MDTLPSLDQEKVSEQLQLLRELGCSDPDISHYTGQEDIRHSPNIRAELFILNTITMSMSTGSPGGTIAAAFDRRERLCLVLAKNTAPNDEDHAAIKYFISSITSPDAHSGIDIFSFLDWRCRANINKRINKLHTHLSKVPSGLTSVLQRYAPLSVDEEFPGQDLSVRMPHEGQKPSCQAILTSLFRECSSRSAFQLCPDDVNSSAQQYSQLFIVADILVRSRFMNALTHECNGLYSVHKKWAKKLRRRLDKICQYVTGIAYVIKRVKQWFPDGNIPYRWVNDTPASQTFALGANAMDVISNAYGCERPSLGQILEGVAVKFPRMFVNWKRRRLISPCIHAEIRIILHLTPLSPSGFPIEVMQRLEQQPIGSSKPSCLGCLLWIHAYNSFVGTQWTTSQISGKPDANWALPSVAYVEGVDGNMYNDIDAIVMQQVSMLLTDTVKRVLPDAGFERR